MSYFPICKDFGIKVDMKNKRYIFAGFLYKGRIVLSVWEELAFMMVVFTDFSRKELEKGIIYKIGCLEIFRAEKNSRHSLCVQIDIEGPVIYLNATEVRFFPAICNRILARCDILMRENEYEKVVDNHWIGNEKGQI